MPRKPKPPRLVLRTEPDGSEVWIIRDRAVYQRTGISRECEEEAAQALADYLAARLPARRGPARPHEITVGEVLAHYLDGHGSEVVDVERLGYTIKALAPFWGNQKMDAVKGATCRRYARERKHQGVKSGTARRELATLSAAINWCLEEGLILYAPKVALPKRTAPKDRFLTRDEAALALRTARRLGPERRYMARFIIIALYTGTRKTAILGLRTTPSLTSGWVDNKAGVIHRKGAGEEETKKRRGTVRMSRKLAGHMRRFCARANTHVIEYRGRPVDDVRMPWREIRRLAPALADVTPHIFKHTAITWAIANGMSKEDAESYFDTSAATIETVYRHHSPHYQREAAAIMDKKGR